MNQEYHAERVPFQGAMGHAAGGGLDDAREAISELHSTETSRRSQMSSSGPERLFFQSAATRAVFSAAAEPAAQYSEASPSLAQDSSAFYAVQRCSLGGTSSLSGQALLRASGERGDAAAGANASARAALKDASSLERHCLSGRGPHASPLRPASEGLASVGTASSGAAASALLSPSFARRVRAEQRRQQQRQLSLGEVYAHLYTPGASPSFDRGSPAPRAAPIRPVDLLSPASGPSSAGHGQNEGSWSAQCIRGRRSTPSIGLAWEEGAGRHLGPSLGSTTSSLPSVASRRLTPLSVSSVQGVPSASATGGGRPRPYRRLLTAAGASGNVEAVGARGGREGQRRDGLTLVASSLRAQSRAPISRFVKADLLQGAGAASPGMTSWNGTEASAGHRPVGGGEKEEDEDGASLGPAGAGGQIWGGRISDTSSVAPAANNEVRDQPEGASWGARTPEESSEEAAAAGPLAVASRWLKTLVQGKRREDDSSAIRGGHTAGSYAYSSEGASPTSGEVAESSAPPFRLGFSSRSDGRGDELDDDLSERSERAEGQPGGGKRGFWPPQSPAAKRFLAASVEERGVDASYSANDAEPRDAWLLQGAPLASDLEGFVKQRYISSLVDADYGLDPRIRNPGVGDRALARAAEERMDAAGAMRAVGVVEALEIQQSEVLLSPFFFRRFILAEVTRSLDELVKIYADESEVSSEAKSEGTGRDKVAREGEARANPGDNSTGASSPPMSAPAERAVVTPHSGLLSNAASAADSECRGASEPESSSPTGSGEAHSTDSRPVADRASSGALGADMSLRKSQEELANGGKDLGGGKHSGRSNLSGGFEEVDAEGASGGDTRAEACERRTSAGLMRTERGGLLFAFNACVLDHREKLESFAFMLNTLRHLQCVIASSRATAWGPDSGLLSFADTPACGSSLAALRFYVKGGRAEGGEGTPAPETWRERRQLSASSLLEAQIGAGWLDAWRLLPQEARLALGRAVERARRLDSRTRELVRACLRIASPFNCSLPPAAESRAPPAKAAAGGAGEDESLLESREESGKAPRVEREFIRVRTLGDGTELWRVVERTPVDAAAADLADAANRQAQAGVGFWVSLLGEAVYEAEELKGWKLALQALCGEAADSAAKAPPRRASAAGAAKPRTVELVEEVERELGGALVSRRSMLSEAFLKTLASLFPGQTPRIECIDMLAATLNTMDFLAVQSSKEPSPRRASQSRRLSAAEIEAARRPAIGQPLVHCLDAVNVPDGIVDPQSPRMQTVVLQLVQDVGIHFQRLWNRLTASAVESAPGDAETEAHLLIPLYGPFTAYLIVFKLERVCGSQPSAKRQSACSERGGDACRCTYQVLDCVAAAAGTDEETRGRRAADVDALASMLSTMLWTKGSLRFLKKTPTMGALGEKVMMSVLPSRRSWPCIPAPLTGGGGAQDCANAELGDANPDSVAKLALLAESGEFTPDCCGIILMFSIEAFYSGHRAGLLTPAAVTALRFLYARRIFEVFVLRKSLLHSCALPMFRAVQRPCAAGESPTYLAPDCPSATGQPTLCLGASV
ncbi:hypothetical protein BESB_055650 [Besnoitia besnoiti]|uniref:Uncharacterized protein n=1 Tax=Besnoitia besnoiti TaxID=94643 RepID=A0A2A9MFE2_BESBE|nr:hypothetical protein BESB_055650 [Besnoitia besnoiti]PFH35914.1 hypothetical protein BESB_055650 [Besnoitia besnoiti]